MINDYRYYIKTILHEAKMTFTAKQQFSNPKRSYSQTNKLPLVRTQNITYCKTFPSLILFLV